MSNQTIISALRKQLRVEQSVIDSQRVENDRLTTANKTLHEYASGAVRQLKIDRDNGIRLSEVVSKLRSDNERLNSVCNEMRRDMDGMELLLAEARNDNPGPEYCWEDRSDHEDIHDLKCGWCGNCDTCRKHIEIANDITEEEVPF